MHQSLRLGKRDRYLKLIQFPHIKQSSPVIFLLLRKGKVVSIWTSWTAISKLTKYFFCFFFFYHGNIIKIKVNTKATNDVISNHPLLQTGMAVSLVLSLICSIVVRVNSSISFSHYFVNNKQISLTSENLRKKHLQNQFNKNHNHRMAEK